jgi:hypothetical protein
VIGNEKTMVFIRIYSTCLLELFESFKRTEKINKTIVVAIKTINNDVSTFHKSISILIMSHIERIEIIVIKNTKTMSA